jgi:hypothetical protein
MTDVNTYSSICRLAPELLETRAQDQQELILQLVNASADGTMNG